MARSLDETAQVVRRLNILISLTLDTMDGGASMAVATKIRRLSEIGVPASDITGIVGKPMNYVTATLSQQKAAKRK
ncbi:MAG TPA: hypothetical protein VER58_17700 [Thermoanaerobaculia bacterium]|nr:hypothetical protein [Thermoanaerobaculia bacterium]